MNKKSLVIISFMVILFSISNISFSQTLKFCTDYNDDGHAINPGSTFYIPSSGGYIYFLVNLPYDLNCTYVSYEIYTVDEYNYESYSTTIDQTGMGKNWVWFAKKVTFYDRGYYHVYVRDCFNYVLTDSYVTIYFK
jgi:hypothetical protein